MSAQFECYVGIDYSGAATPRSKLKGLSVYVADRGAEPVEVQRKWSRRGVAEWLDECVAAGRRTAIGIDHGFSFPLEYFTKYQLALDWQAFLEDFCAHWPTDEEQTRVQDLRAGNRRTGDSRWRRIAEVRTGAKSVFHFDVPGSVAKSTHAGLPWLLYLRRQWGKRVHFWPFDGWDIPAGKSVVFEAYPSLWNKSFPSEARDAHQHDAYSIAAWLRTADEDGRLDRAFHPEVEAKEREIAQLEGWILGAEAKRVHPGTRAKLVTG